jgi:hypothetical protein
MSDENSCYQQDTAQQSPTKAFRNGYLVQTPINRCGHRIATRSSNAIKGHLECN